MCGRFTSLLSPQLLADIYNVPAPVALHPRYNIAPTQEIMTVRQRGEGERDLSPMRWGIVPHWVKDVSIGSKLINARCETVHEKPSFRQAIRSRRCIVPASGFFEWMSTTSGKVPYYNTMRDGTPFSVAGIWETWKSPDGETLETCAILTTGANSMMAPIHDRMPVIPHHGEFDLWLDRSVCDPQSLQRLYQSYPSDLMQSWQVSKMVNKPDYDSYECIRPQHN